jgi:FixJ family two-component response regulator
MTGSTDPRFPVWAAEAGCVAFLQKPFSAGKFIETLSRAVQPPESLVE